ncbi:MAG: potassium channel family protein [Sandaracinaceae bacterium]
MRDGQQEAPRRDLPDIRVPRARHITTFVALLTLLILPDLVGPFPTLHWLLDLAFALFIVSGVVEVRRSWRVLAALGVVALTVRVAGPWLEPAHSGPAGLAVLLLFLLFLTARILISIFHAPRVTGDTLIGSINGYLVVGLSFAVAFSLLELLWPGSLQSGGAALFTEVTSKTILVDGAGYFSFVTLTTLGYGDIVPVAPAARTLAVLEAVIGQLYVAILIAWLVSQLQRSSGGSGADGP